MRRLQMATTRPEFEEMWKNSGMPERIYQINYRLAAAKSSTKGDYNTRYKGLTDLINTLSVHVKHDETSSYLVKTRQPDASGLGNYLVPPLDEKLDSVHVIEIKMDPINRSTFN